MLKDFSQDLVVNIIRRFGVSIVFLGSIKIFTEKLSPIEFGNYTVMLFIITLVSTLVTSWLTAGYLRFNKDYNDSYSFFNTVFNIHIISILLGIIVLSVILLFISMSNIINIKHSLFVFLLTNFIGLSFFNFFSTVYIANRQIKSLGYITIFQALIALVLSVFLLKYNIKVECIFLSNTISYLIVNIYFFSRIIKPEHTIKINKTFFWDTVKYSSPLVLMNFLSLVLISGDQLLMKFFGLKEDIGVYSANYAIIDKTVTLFTSIFTISYIPLLFSNWKELGEKATYNNYKKIVLIYLIIILLLGVFFIRFYNEFIFLLIDKKFINKGLLIFILLGSIFLNLTNVISEVFTLNKRTDLLALCFIPPTIINLLGNIIFIPKYGVYSAAYLTVFSYLLLFVTAVIIAKKYIIK